MPGGKSRRGLWILVAAAAVVVIAVAVAVPLVLARGEESEQVTTTSPTSVVSSTTTTVVETTSTTEPQASTSTTTSTTTTAGDPGDSAGEWVEMDIPEAPASVFEVAVSDSWLLCSVQADTGPRLVGSNLVSGESVDLPVEGPNAGSIDIDGNTAVWWEGVYDDASGTYSDQHIYLYELPDGPKVEIAGAGDKDVRYPQTAGVWVTWVEPSPWDVSPEEYWRVPIYGSLVPGGSDTTNEPMELAPAPIAAILGDAVWSYSVADRYLAWEQEAEADGLETGTYVLDLSEMPAGPEHIGSEAWRPSLGGNMLVYWEDGLHVLDLASGDRWDLDAAGDFPTAAPTFAAYFRSVAGADGTTYEIVARGFKGEREQVLGKQADPPWLSLPIAASGSHIAFVSDVTLHVFEWKGR
jgi:hypothetical protein